MAYLYDNYIPTIIQAQLNIRRNDFSACHMNFHFFKKPTIY